MTTDDQQSNSSLEKAPIDLVGPGPFASKPFYPMCPHCGQFYRPGELVCLNCGIVFQNRLATRPREEPAITAPTCSNCGSAHQPGALVCQRCGAILNLSMDSTRRDDTQERPPA